VLAAVEDAQDDDVLALPPVEGEVGVERVEIERVEMERWSYSARFGARWGNRARRSKAPSRASA
jgi:hypothetical protein